MFCGPVVALFADSWFDKAASVQDMDFSGETEIEQGLTSHQTHYRSDRVQVFTGQMTQPTVSKALKGEGLAVI